FAVPGVRRFNPNRSCAMNPCRTNGGTTAKRRTPRANRSAKGPAMTFVEGIAVAKSYRLSPAERARLDRDGYVVRERAFDAEECAAIAEECESLAAELLAAKRSKKHVVGSYMFERQEAFGINVKWEPASPDLVMGIEPFAHHSKALKDVGYSPRLLDPCPDTMRR